MTCCLTSFLHLNFVPNFIVDPSTHSQAVCAAAQQFHLGRQSDFEADVPPQVLKTLSISSRDLVYSQEQQPTSLVVTVVVVVVDGV